ncbi:DUF6776 family protein [Pseudidiomarina insulisalsae]|uniref:Uncharacterized protein n=1 Tax=Pseudidiomarina insulisalsae TaxID=575789 RepID=A0A432YA46_9GAMM|nr:DUF6776 family protein [Pseudidiomarina insulisalsae]RUO57817.1 hypothetical protein CWI71_11575 [Pseudidiomarina insulisalsae]
MNEKQKYIRVGIIASLALAVGYLLGMGQNWYLHDHVSELETQVERLYEQAETADYQQHIAEVELGIEQAAGEQLQQQLAASQDEILALRRELSFYQKIMAPELAAEGVVIDEFELKSLAQEGHYQFRLAVLQTNRQRGYVKGTVSARLEGRGPDGEALSFDLYELAALDPAEKEFSMRYFKVQTGSFQLPTDFAPEQVRLVVELEEGSNKTLERLFLWSELVGGRNT